MFQNKTDLLNLFIVAPELFPNPLMGHFSTQYGHYIRVMLAFMLLHEQWKSAFSKNNSLGNQMMGATLSWCPHCRKFAHKRDYFPYRNQRDRVYYATIIPSKNILKEDEYISPPLYPVI